MFKESRTITTYNETGIIWKTRVELEQDTCSDWPMHTFGRVVSTFRGKEIAKSWMMNPFLLSPFMQMISRGISGYNDVKFLYHAFVGVRLHAAGGVSAGK